MENSVKGGVEFQMPVKHSAEDTSSQVDVCLELREDVCSTVKDWEVSRAQAEERVK